MCIILKASTSICTKHTHHHHCLRSPYLQIRYYGDASAEVDWASEDAPAVDPHASAHEHQQYQDGVQYGLRTLSTPVSTIASVAQALRVEIQAGMVLIQNPVHDNGLVDCAKRVYMDNLDILALPYLDELHQQLSNLFVQTDGRPPAWARTGRNTGLVEATIKHNKHTQVYIHTQSAHYLSCTCILCFNGW